MSFCGLAGLIERESRLVELSTYCITYALDCLTQELLHKGKIPTFSFVGPLALVFSTAIILQKHEEQKMPFFTKWLCGLP